MSNATRSVQSDDESDTGPTLKRSDLMLIEFSAARAFEKLADEDAKKLSKPLSFDQMKEKMIEHCSLFAQKMKTCSTDACDSVKSEPVFQSPISSATTTTSTVDRPVLEPLKIERSNLHTIETLDSPHIQFASKMSGNDVIQAVEATESPIKRSTQVSPETTLAVNAVVAAASEINEITKEFVNLFSSHTTSRDAATKDTYTGSKHQGEGSRSGRYDIISIMAEFEQLEKRLIQFGEEFADITTSDSFASIASSSRRVKRSKLANACIEDGSFFNSFSNSAVSTAETGSQTVCEFSDANHTEHVQYDELLKSNSFDLSTIQEVSYNKATLEICMNNFCFLFTIFQVASCNATQNIDNLSKSYSFDDDDDGNIQSYLNDQKKQPIDCEAQVASPFHAAIPDDQILGPTFSVSYRKPSPFDYLLGIFPTKLHYEDENAGSPTTTTTTTTHIKRRRSHSSGSSSSNEDSISSESFGSRLDVARYFYTLMDHDSEIVHRVLMKGGHKLPENGRLFTYRHQYCTSPRDMLPITIAILMEIRYILEASLMVHYDKLHLLHDDIFDALTVHKATRAYDYFITDLHTAIVRREAAITKINIALQIWRSTHVLANVPQICDETLCHQSVLSELVSRHYGVSDAILSDVHDITTNDSFFLKRYRVPEERCRFYCAANDALYCGCASCHTKNYLVIREAIPIAHLPTAATVKHEKSTADSVPQLQLSYYPISAHIPKSDRGAVAAMQSMLDLKMRMLVVYFMHNTFSLHLSDHQEIVRQSLIEASKLYAANNLEKLARLESNTLRFIEKCPFAMAMLRLDEVEEKAERYLDLINFSPPFILEASVLISHYFASRLE